MNERLDFVLPDFTRVQWAAESRFNWERKFFDVSNAWQRVEIALVAAGVKPSALLVVLPVLLPDISQLASSEGLLALVLARQGSTGLYSATTTPYVEGQPFEYRVAICTKAMAEHWITAWRNSDNDMMGILLGYPECCRRFFSQFWEKEGYVDTTWLQAVNTSPADSNDVVNVHPDPSCNVTLRHLGLRWVSHLPCSFKCQPTIAMVADYAPVIETKFPEVYRTLSEALQWPVKWTGLHGIAEIVTPVCRIISRTDATATVLTVKQHGALYPQDGTRGVGFPFQNAGTHHVKVLVPDRWTLNGFNSYEAMIKAHNVVIEAADDMRGKSIIDLGCGTGELLKIYRGIASELHGVEILPEAVKQAKKFINVREMNIYDFGVFHRDFDVAFISVQRFLENWQWADLMELLRKHTKETIFYSYGGMEGWSTINETPKIVIGPNSALKVKW